MGRKRQAMPFVNCQAIKIGMPVVIANDTVTPSSLRTVIEGLVSGPIEPLNGLKFVFKGNPFNTSPRFLKSEILIAYATFAIASTPSTFAIANRAFK